MTPSQKSKCNIIIHTNATAAAGVAAGLAQIPLIDKGPLAAIEIEMIIALGKVFDRNITKDAALAIIASVAGTTVGRSISQLLLGWIPGYGNAVNASTAAAVVESIGWAAVKFFDA